MSKTLWSFILLLVATVLILFWQSIGVSCLHMISHFYSFCMQSLHGLIHDHLLRQILVIVFVSLVLGLIPVFIYWIMHRRWYQGYMSVVWCVWVILMTMIIVRAGAH